MQTCGRHLLWCLPTRTAISFERQFSLSSLLATVSSVVWIGCVFYCALTRWLDRQLVNRLGSLLWLSKTGQRKRNEALAPTTFDDWTHIFSLTCVVRVGVYTSILYWSTRNVVVQFGERFAHCIWWQIRKGQKRTLSQNLMTFFTFSERTDFSLTGFSWEAH